MILTSSFYHSRILDIDKGWKCLTLLYFTIQHHCLFFLWELFLTKTHSRQKRTKKDMSFNRPNFLPSHAWRNLQSKKRMNVFLSQKIKTL